jgi:hypothetical protein
MKIWGCIAILAVGLTLVATQVRTQPTGPARSQDSGAASASDIDPDAMAALNRMGTYLRGLKAFLVRSTTSREDVLENGQKIEYEAVTDVLVQKPDQLRLETTNDRQRRLYLYDGKKFTLYAERLNYYATVPAPPTISQLVDNLQDKFDIELPLADLFSWGTDKSKVGDIKVATDVGPAQVEGTTCEQFAFRQEGIDWQIWIQDGDYPLPRKLIITTLSDDARPQYRAVLTWNLAPSFNEAAFTFDPPKDAHQIVFAQANQPSSGEKQ